MHLARLGAGESLPWCVDFHHYQWLRLHRLTLPRYRLGLLRESGLRGLCALVDPQSLPVVGVVGVGVAGMHGLEYSIRLKSTGGLSVDCRNG